MVVEWYRLQYMSTHLARGTSQAPSNFTRLVTLFRRYINGVIGRAIRGSRARSP
jgi:hypothetical protein